MNTALLLDGDWLQKQEALELTTALKLFRSKRSRKRSALSAATTYRTKRFKKQKPGKVVTVSSGERIRRYREYLTSELWLSVRSRHIRTFGRDCVVCGSTEGTQVHHLVHRGFGNERPNDLVSVCREHHEQFHTEYGRGRRDYTGDFIAFCERERPKYGMPDCG